MTTFSITWFKMLKTSHIVMLAARRGPQERAEGSTKQDRLTLLLCILWHSLAGHPTQVQTSSLKSWAALTKQIRGWLLQAGSSPGSPRPSHPHWVPPAALGDATGWGTVGATARAGFSLELGRTVVVAGAGMEPCLSPKHRSLLNLHPKLWYF